MEWENAFKANIEFGVCTCISISPDNESLAVSTSNGVIELFKLRNNYELKVSKLVHSKGINHIVWSSNSKFILSCSMDQKMKLVDSSTLDEIVTYEGITGEFTSCDISHSCDLVAGGNRKGYLHLYSTASNKSRIMKPTHTDQITSVKFFESIYVMTSSLDGLVRISSCDNLATLKSYCGIGPISCASFAPFTDNIIFANMGDNNCIQVYDLLSGIDIGEFIGYINKEHPFRICWIKDNAKHADPLVVIASEDGRIIAYDFRTQNQFLSFQLHNGYFRFDISKNGDCIATFDAENREINVWKLKQQ